ncbi:MAG TPA: c-type cytochrome [Gammaproteobacteria bacterium]|nr:c-type cytochrome [Gammaproteobacteria bacterium]
MFLRSKNLAAAGLAVTTALAAATALPQQTQSPPPVGNAERGRVLFQDTYNCYACHGFEAQTGERRLVPMNYPVEGFIAFVQNSPLPQMPAFPDASAQTLADIWAYLKSVPLDAPPLNDLPLLRDVLARRNQAAGGK